MSLRDIGNSLELAINQFVRDLELASSTSPLDWPIYLIVLAIPFVFIGLVIAMSAVIIPLAALSLMIETYSAKQFDVDGNPTTRLGRVARWSKEIASYSGLFIIIWFFIWMILGTLFTSGIVSSELDTDFGNVVAMTFAAIVSGVIILLAIRGRFAMSRENQK